MSESILQPDVRKLTTCPTGVHNWHETGKECTGNSKAWRHSVLVELVEMHGEATVLATSQTYVLLAEATNKIYGAAWCAVQSPIICRGKRLILSPKWHRTWALMDVDMWQPEIFRSVLGMDWQDMDVKGVRPCFEMDFHSLCLAFGASGTEQNLAVSCPVRNRCCYGLFILAVRFLFAWRKSPKRTLRAVWTTHTQTNPF